MADESSVDIIFKELIASYWDIKIVFESILRRKGKKPIDGILNEIRALNDHISRCYRDGVGVDKSIAELHKAQGHLKRLIYDCL